VRTANLALKFLLELAAFAVAIVLGAILAVLAVANGVLLAAFGQRAA
jgi:hypothetical protein